jgi:CrcB protein
MSDLLRLALVVVGGGAGAGLRFLVGLRVPVALYPWHTLGINAAGSFALGLLAGACRDRPGWYALLGVGACGGFTTFSTFSLETLTLWDEGRGAKAAGYVAGSVAAALAGCWVGLRLGRAGS